MQRKVLTPNDFASLAALEHYLLASRMAVLYVRIYARGFRPAASLPTSGSRPGAHTLERLDAALTKFLQEVRLVA